MACGMEASVHELLLVDKRYNCVAQSKSFPYPTAMLAGAIFLPLTKSLKNCPQNITKWRKKK